MFAYFRLVFEECAFNNQGKEILFSTDVLFQYNKFKLKDQGYSIYCESQTKSCK